MSQQLGNEVERQGKARQTSQLHPGQLFLFKDIVHIMVDALLPTVGVPFQMSF